MPEMNEKKKYNSSTAEYVEIISSDIVTISPGQPGYDRYEGEVDWEEGYGPDGKEQ